ncbi:MAG TPA: translational GTPase TypA, partial [Cyanothece sp. UBA12306]|nr:translational GTPase TypA [Cyanothece sp. UBA12306]
PGHADFGGEVERVMSMVDCVLLLVDAVDGPMPQTRFVTQKAFAAGLKPIVVINKIDRPGARPDWVMDQVFDLFDNLGATDEQLDFPVIYASALNGIAGLDPSDMADDMTPLFQAIVDKVKAPDVDLDGPFQMQVSSLDYNSYVGMIGIGRIKRGKVKTNSPVKVIDRDGKTRNGRLLTIMGHHGLERVEVPEATAGDIVCITGLDPLDISDTICDPNNVEALPPLTVDEPTVSMTFQVNTSPFAGQEGKYVTSRNIRDRLHEELKYNVALRVEDTDSPDPYQVYGRGELQMSVLIETMRREGYEFQVSQPQVIYREVGGQPCEPYEYLVLDVPEEAVGSSIERLGQRKGEMRDMQTGVNGRTQLEFVVPARGLIGFRGEFIRLSRGEGIMNHSFLEYRSFSGDLETRYNGVITSFEEGVATFYALKNAEDRGVFFITPGTKVYKGMIIGESNRPQDVELNVCKTKQLTNHRSATGDELVQLQSPEEMSLERALEYIGSDELVEVTPESIRLRKMKTKKLAKR